MTTVSALPLPLLRQAELETYFAVSDWTVNQWVRHGCPVQRLPNGHRRFDLAAVKEWMAAQSRAGQQTTAARSEHALSRRAG